MSLRDEYIALKSQGGGTLRDEYLQMKAMAAGGASDSPPSSQAVTASPPTNYQPPQYGRPETWAGANAPQMNRYAYRGMSADLAARGAARTIEPVRAAGEQITQNLKEGAKANPYGLGPFMYLAGAGTGLANAFIVGAPRMANELINPEDYTEEQGITPAKATGQALSGIGRGLRGSGYQGAEFQRGFLRSAGVPEKYVSNPYINLPATGMEGLADVVNLPYSEEERRKLEEEAVQQQQADPSSFLQNMAILQGGVKGAVGAVRKARGIMRGLRDTRQPVNMIDNAPEVTPAPAEELSYLGTPRSKTAIDMSVAEYGQTAKEMVGKWEKYVAESPTESNKMALERWKQVAENPAAEHLEAIQSALRVKRADVPITDYVSTKALADHPELFLSAVSEQPKPTEIQNVNPQNVTRPPSGIEQGQAIEQAQPVRSGGKEAAQTGGVVQASSGEVAAKPTKNEIRKARDLARLSDLKSQESQLKSDLLSVADTPVVDYFFEKLTPKQQDAIARGEVNEPGAFLTGKDADLYERTIQRMNIEMRLDDVQGEIGAITKRLPKVKTSSPGPVAAKQPWETTQSEYIKDFYDWFEKSDYDKKELRSVAANWHVYKYKGMSVDQILRARHKELISCFIRSEKDVVRAGKEFSGRISAEVLAPYPDLAKDYAGRLDYPDLAGRDIQARTAESSTRMPKAMEPGQAGPTTINDIRQHFERSVETPIRTGKYSRRVGGANAAGIYKTEADVIRLKDYGDIESLSHEVAHAVEKKNDLTPFLKQHADELMPLAYEEAKNWPVPRKTSEGFAEYLRHYMTGSGDAKVLAPKFTQAFETFLDQHPDLKSTIAQGKKLFDSWRSQGAEARVKAAMVYKPSRGPIVERLQTIKNAYLRKFFDVLTPIRHYTEAVERVAGRKLRGEENPFDLATVTKNKASARADNWIHDVTADFDGKATGEGLSLILKKVAGNEEKAIEYAYAKHGIERWEQGKNPGSDLADLKYFVEKNKSPEFEQFSKDLSAYRDRLLQYVVDAGGIDPGTAKLFRSIYKSSIPLYREGFETGGAGVGGTKYINPSQPIKRAHGSGRTVINPLAGLMKETERLIKFADERRVGNSIIDAAEKYPGLGQWVEKVSLGAKPTHLNIEQAVKNLKDAGIDVSSLSPDELTKALTTWGQQTHGVPAENIITRFKDGKVEAYQVNKELMEGLSGLNKPQVEGVLRYLTYPKKAIAAGATALRASFSLLTNPLRDPWSAMMQSRLWRTTPFQSVGGMFRAAIHRLGLDAKVGLDPAKYDLMKRVGMEQAQFFNAELPRAMENAKRLIADNARSKAMNVARHPIDLYRAVLNTPEAGPRAAEFVAVYDKVFKETGNERTAWIEAGNAYQDVTMNFSRSGSYGAFLNQFIPFLNPALQEPGLIARSFRRAPVATTVKGIGLMTIPTVALWLQNKDQDWYKATPTWEKATFWHFKIGETVWRLPKPFLWGSMFASFPEATLDAIAKKDPSLAIDMAKQIVGNTIPSITPGFAAPIGATIGEQGYDFFRGRPIVPRSQVENLPPEERYGKYTTETAKAIGDVLNVSPTKVDYTISQLTGGLGTDIIHGIEKPFTNKPESQGLENNLAIGRLVSRSPYINKFYDELTEYQDRMKEIDLKPVANRTQEEKDYLTRGKYLEHKGRELSDLRKQVTTISKSDKSGEVKGREIDALNKKMEDIAHKAIYPTAKPRAEAAPLPEIYASEHIDSIPANLTVRVNVIHADTGKRVERKMNARRVVRELTDQLVAYNKVMELLG